MIGWGHGSAEFYDDFHEDVLPDDDDERDIVLTAPLDTAIRLLLVAASFGIVFAIFFSAFPFVDLHLAEFFHIKDRVFFGHQPLVEMVRDGFKFIFILVCVLAIVGAAISILASDNWRGWTAPKWIFLVMCLSVGPGIVANVMFKDQWGRARPKQIELLGGEKLFTTALMPTNQCHRNCSFISGEASSMFAVFFALALLMGRHSATLLSLGVAAGLGAGLIRMMQGGHFLSDVLFAGVFMALTVAVAYLLTFPAVERRTAWRRVTATGFQNLNLNGVFRST